MDDFFKDIELLVSKGCIDDAIVKLDTVDENSPDYGKALFFKSNIMSQLGDMDVAQELYKEAVIFEVSKSSGIDADVLRDNDFKKVSDELDDITLSSIIFNMGLEFYEVGDYTNALNSFDNALELNPNDDELIYFKSLALANLGDFDIAIDFIGRAIEINPDDDRYWNDKANFLIKLSNFNEAIYCYNKSIELNPDDSVFWANKGFLYIQMEEYKKALKCYKKAYKLDSDNIHNIVGLANVYVELYDFNNADKYFRKAKKLDDENEEYLTAMAQYMICQQKFDKSIEYWDKILKIYPDKAEVWMYKSMVYMMMNNELDANKCIEKAFELNPDVVGIFEEEISNFIGDDL